MCAISEISRGREVNDHEIQMREMQVAGVFGEDAQFASGPDLAMAHRLVPGMESLPERIG